MHAHTHTKIIVCVSVFVSLSPTLLSPHTLCIYVSACVCIICMGPALSVCVTTAVPTWGTGGGGGGTGGGGGGVVGGRKKGLLLLIEL